MPTNQLFELDQLVAQAAPLTDALEVREDSETSWVFAMTEEILISVDFDDTRDVVVLTANLGKPPTGNAQALYALLLEMTTLWRDTGGLRMGLDAADGFVTQVIDLSVRGLEAPRLAEALANFAELATAWRRILRHTEDTMTYDSEYIRV